MWHRCHKDGWESVEGDPRSGKPATSKTPENVGHVQAAINRDQWLTVWEQEADLGIPKTIVSEILMQDLVMKCIVAKFVLQLQLPEQKEHYAEVGGTVWGPKVPTLKVTEVSLLYVQCFLYLIFSSINVSIFWLHGWILSGQTLYIWRMKFLEAKNFKVNCFENLIGISKLFSKILYTQCFWGISLKYKEFYSPIYLIIGVTILLLDKM